MRVVYLDVKNNKADIRDIKDDLQVFYDLIGCRCVEMPERRIGVHGTHYYNIICDEEGLLKDSPIISAIDNFGNPMLFGNLIICKVNYESGELVELTEKEAERVSSFIQDMSVQNLTSGEVKQYKMLTQCEF